MLLILTGVAIGIYMSGLLICAWNHFAGRSVERAPTPPVVPVSIIVAARNEEVDLPACLTALSRQNYPVDLLEILVADDHSDDRTRAVAEAVARRDPRFRVVDVSRYTSPRMPPGKARALHAAITQSKGELLLVTDADCAPPPGWTAAMVAQFRHPRTGMICGVALVRHGNTFEEVQALDWLFLLAVASAASDLRLPITAMGNDMAFRREAYEAVGGYPALPPTVTEDFALLQALRRTGRWRVSLRLDPDLTVQTLPLQNLKDVIEQRKRWARGSLSGPWWQHLLLAAVAATHLLLVVCLLVSPAAGTALLLLKIAGELVLLLAAMRRMRSRIPLRALPGFEGLLFLYTLLLPLLLVASPSVRWRGRMYGRSFTASDPL